MRIRSILACAGVAPLLIAAAQPVRLQPSSPWDVDYAPESCRLIRTFGQGKTLTKLAFESATPGQMDMLVIGKPLQTYDEKVPARFLPIANQPIDGTVASAVPTGDPAILWSNVPLLPDDILARIKAEKEQAKRNPGVRPPADSETQAARWAQRQQFAVAATELEIDSRRNRPIILETGSLGPAMAALDTCSRNSLKDWGVDPAVEDKIARPVWAVNLSHWLFASDYPRDMLATGNESEVSVRLLIDASGKVTKCTSLSHFKEQEFNRISCEMITKRARFEPAELADGTKVPSYYTQRVIFRLAY